MNFGILTRIASLITGIVIILVLPYFLSDQELQKFYILYATLPIVAIVDFGFIAKILSAKSNCEIFNFQTLKLFVSRCLLVGVSSALIIYYLPYSAIADIIFLSPAIIILYSSIVMLAIVEASVSFETSYKIRFISEISLFIAMIVLCFSKTPEATSLILLVLAFRSTPAIFYFIFKIDISMFWNNIKSKKNIISDNFSIKVGIVSIMGYLSGQATNWIVAFNFSLKEGLAYNQSYFIISTIFSLTMSYLIYYQVTFKTEGNIYNKYLEIRKIYLTQLCLSFSFLVAVGLGAIFFVNIYISVIKFDMITFFLVFTLFFTLIHNHIAAIVFRINGKEILFDLSIISSLFVIFSFLLIGYYFDSIFVLIINLMIGLIVNFYLTHILVKRRA